MKRHVVSLLARLFVLWTSVSFSCFADSPSDVLGPGSNAPALEVREWIKGDEVKELSPKGIYVVEFWATWCGACFECIPHMTQLAKTHPDVEFLGISILEDNDNQQIQTFVAKMGDRMDYRVGYSGNDSGMAKSWTGAAKQAALPTAFVVVDRKIMWIGHPMNLKKPLEQIKSGTFDVNKARSEFDRRLALQEEEQRVQKEVEAATRLFDAGNRTEALSKLDALEQTEMGKSATAPIRFLWLSIADPQSWRKEVKSRIERNTDEGTELSMFVDQNASRVPDQCQWLAQELTQRFPNNWYPWLCGSRMCRKIGNYDKALEFAQKSREAVLEFRRTHPDVPHGNALDVVSQLEETIQAERRSKR